MNNSEDEIMGENFARYYDKIYHWKDYEKESSKILEVLAKHQIESGTMLDVACGTGAHIPYLQNAFEIEGVDLNGHMLEIAREKFPNTQFHQGDMRDFDLGKQFDVVVCLFSAIAYMTTPADLQKAINNFKRHLKPGGLMIFEGFIEAENFVPNRPSMHNVDEPNLKISRMNLARREGDLVTIDFYFQVATPEGVFRSEERHVLNMFQNGVYLNCMEKADLAAKFMEEGLMHSRGLFIGKKV